MHNQSCSGSSHGSAQSTPSTVSVATELDTKYSVDTRGKIIVQCHSSATRASSPPRLRRVERIRALASLATSLTETTLSSKSTCSRDCPCKASLEKPEFAVLAAASCIETAECAAVAPLPSMVECEASATCTPQLAGGAAGHGLACVTGELREASPVVTARVPRVLLPRLEGEPATSAFTTRSDACSPATTPYALGGGGGGGGGRTAGTRAMGRGGAGRAAESSIELPRSTTRLASPRGPTSTAGMPHAQRSLPHSGGAPRESQRAQKSSPAQLRLTANAALLSSSLLSSPLTSSCIPSPRVEQACALTA
mmetsp:Transcript_207/g.534  ORF Transcript_207/g.534 Transcript_207/m.534 type:complete len:310 (+) Transcript_207:1993-2922(+)